MKCAACGHDYQGDTPIELRYGEIIPFIKIIGCEKEPFKTTLYSISPITGMEVPFRENSHLSATQRTTGVPVTLYACPNCGTVKMEVK